MIAQTPTASAQVHLGLRLRTEATLTGRCACGAQLERFEVTAVRNRRVGDLKAR